MPNIALPHFNLLDEPWIPVIMGDGSRKKMGLTDVFRHADAVRAVEHSSPLATVALHRVMLAILYRSCLPETIDDVAGWFDDGWPLDRITAYLEKWRERFYLLHRTHPFWQVAEYDAVERKPWAVLAAEHNASNGNRSKILFDYPCQWQGVGAPLDKMACWLAAAQIFALPGGSGYAPAPSSAALMAFAVGGNLRETLLLNLPPQEAGVAAGDIPVWEREPETRRTLKFNPRRSPAGYANLYTWNSRAVHLHPEGDGTVSYVGFKPGIGLKKENAPVFYDPMAAYKNNGVPMGLNWRVLWRDFDSLLPRPYPVKSDEDNSRAPLVIEHAEALCRMVGRRPAKLSVMACGQVNDKAKIELWRMECFVLPAAMPDESIDFRNTVRHLLDLAQTWHGWVYNACALFARECIGRNGARQPNASDVRKVVDQMPCMAVYWTHLEQSFKRGLENGFIRNPEQMEAKWFGEIRDAVALAWKAQTEAAVGGDTWTIRAMAKAGGIIGKALKELNESLEGRREPVGKAT